MCGIAGIYRFRARADDDLANLDLSLSAMKERGPDSSGRFSSPEHAFTFGMNRLSIIDVADGDQPIFNQNKSVAVVLNGELYNYIELRQELRAKGREFVTQTDTEVLVHGYEEWGIEALLSRLRGMFTFAIFDFRLRELLLARDRFGIKPLFYQQNDEGFFFASDLRALLANMSVTRRLNRAMLTDYLSLGYPPGPETFISGTYQLEPAHWARVRDGRMVSRERYWQPRYPVAGAADYLDDEQEVLSRLDELLRESVVLHQRSDVPYGAFLSSGLDSSTIAWIMATQSSRKVETFSLGFKEESFDESRQASEIARHFGIENHVVMIDGLDEELVRESLSGWDQPHYDYSSIPSLVVSKFARERVKTVLTGDGGDELFAGYPTYYLPKITGLYRAIPSMLRKVMLEPLVRALPVSDKRMSIDYKLKQFVKGAGESYERGHFNWRLLFSDAEKAALLKSEYWNEFAHRDAFEVFAKYFEETNHADRLNQLLHVDMMTFLLDDCLYKVDRMTMAASLEARTPFLDHPIWEFMSRVSPRLKQPGLKTKWLLRRLMRDRLPPGITRIPKGGFTPPLGRYLRSSLLPFLRGILLDSRSSAEFFERSELERLVDEHKRGQVDHTRRLWALVAFLHWQERVRPT